MPLILIDNLVLLAQAFAIASVLSLAFWWHTKAWHDSPVSFRRWWNSEGFLVFLATLIVTLIAEIP